MDPALLILQKPDSPYLLLLEESLGSLPQPKIKLESLERVGPHDFILWDLWGFGPGESGAAIEKLKESQAGLAVLCDAPNALCLEVAFSCNVNQISISPQNPEALHAALIMGMSNHARIRSGLLESSNLQKMHADRDLVDQAKSVLMRKLGLSESQAMRQLQSHSRQTNTKLPEVARFVLRVEGILAGPGKKKVE